LIIYFSNANTEYFEALMTRNIVVRFASPFDPCPVNVNDEIGLDAHAGYTLAQHLEDLGAQGIPVDCIHKVVQHHFEDGTFQYLGQYEQEIDLSLLDAEMIAIVTSQVLELPVTA
jgi:hypothetical protein